jgi:hypothetical protein
MSIRNVPSDSRDGGATLFEAAARTLEFFYVPRDYTTRAPSDAKLPWEHQSRGPGTTEDRDRLAGKLYGSPPS